MSAPPFLKSFLLKIINNAYQNPDGTSNSISIFEPAGLREDTPIILVFPAMGVKASYYETLGKSLAEKGILVWTTDLRGLGNSSIRPSKKVDFGYKEMLEQDYVSFFTEVNKQHPNRKKIKTR